MDSEHPPPPGSVLRQGILEAALLPKHLLGLLSKPSHLPKLGHFAFLNLGFLAGGAGVTLLCRASVRSACLLSTKPGVSMPSSHRQQVRLSLLVWAVSGELLLGVEVAGGLVPLQEVRISAGDCKAGL